MTNVIRLPTAATSYFQVRKTGRFWAIELVTPVSGRQLRTTVATSGSFDSAVAYAKETAENNQRPLKLPKGGAQ